MTDPIPFADDKDWTWVLDDLCGECGHDVRDFPREAIGTMIHRNAAEWIDVLGKDADTLGLRPRPDKWSGLEYGYHVSDVYELYHFRLGLMLHENGPRYPNWDQD